VDFASAEVTASFNRDLSSSTYTSLAQLTTDTSTSAWELTSFVSQKYWDLQTVKASTPVSDSHYNFDPLTDYNPNAFMYIEFTTDSANSSQIEEFTIEEQALVGSCSGSTTGLTP